MNPYLGYSFSVPDTWIDINGHMNAQYYYIILYNAGVDFATHLGMGPGMPARCGRSQVVVETHTHFERETLLGDELVVHSLIVDFDRKRLHFLHQLHNATRGYRSATMEQLQLHIDSARHKTADFSPDLLANFEATMALQGPVPPPSDIGRQILLKRHVERERAIEAAV
ncbi:MAG TPA: thioesterase family protein [Alphaproteobacteria bacterium]|nr:thioesterase family protein [Alphaproteobacteria bacterium]